MILKKPKRARTKRHVCFGLLTSLTLLSAALPAQPIKIGSKHFNESYILAEIMAQLLESRGHEVERTFGLGGTLICYQALVNGEIDLYPEYSGTIIQAILKLQTIPSYEELQSLLAQNETVRLLDPFGFNNTYALTTRADMAQEKNLRTISDLRRHTGLRYGFSYEYIERGDGWRALARFYNLAATPRGMEHSLSYQALAEGKIDVMDVYSTDAEIQKYHLTLLVDDKQFFPTYLAAPLLRGSLPQTVSHTLELLKGTIDEQTMQSLNAEVAIARKSFAETANDFLLRRNLKDSTATGARNSRWHDLADKTATHLWLTGVALLLAVLVALPAGMLIYKMQRISGPLIYLTGLLQTVPSLALLALMIPVFGIGARPALVALFLYALLPILRNTFTGLNSIDPVLKKVAVGMGLTGWQRLRHVEIPLSMPTILAGIRTAAVILIGTATIAAFIGAGGLGEYIVTGLSLNDPYLIMWGAIPAALLAIVVELLFEVVERWLVPRHLRRGGESPSV